MFQSLGQKSRSVFAPVTAFSFNAKQRDACRSFLGQRSDDTEAVPVVDEAQLLLAADGRFVETGYRFNAIGFAAVASALLPGLNSAFNDLSGEARRNIATATTADNIAAAVGIYNMALRSRFDLLRERTLLINHREKAVEGFLGLEHRMMDNSVFFDLVAEELATCQDNAVFHRAELVGRELRLYYLDTRTKRTTVYVDPAHTFAAGWYFSNREDTGLALRATLCVFTKFGAAIEPRSKTTSIRHIGADLNGRATALVAKCCARTVNMDDLTTAVRKLTSVGLGLSSSKKAVDATTRKLIEYLARFKINRDDAKHICKNAAIVGADLVPRSLVEAYAPEVLASRTLYDLFCSTLRHAKNQYHLTRDLLQGAAMQMLNIEENQK